MNSFINTRNKPEYSFDAKSPGFVCWELNFSNWVSVKISLWTLFQSATKIKLSWNSLMYSCIDEIISPERFSDRQAILHFVPTNFLPKILENIVEAPLTLRFNFEDFPRSEIRFWFN